MRRLLRAVLLPAALFAGLFSVPARAEILLPSDFITSEGMRQFQVCRAATFYHLNGAPDPQATVPQAVARTLLDQINFIIFESISNKTPASVADGLRLISFTEKWILEFGRVIREEKDRLSDLALREEVLNDCVPVIWGIVRSNIDYLMEYRTRALAPLPFGDPAERLRRQDEVIRRLMGDE